MKSKKKLIVLSSVIILIVLIFLFFQKLQGNNNSNNSKGNVTISTEDLKDKEASKNDGKTPESNSENVSGALGENQTSSDYKDKGNDKTAADYSNQQGIRVFASAANFGTTAEIVIDSSKFNKDYKYYQFYSENKPVSKIESITVLQTTIFPAEEAGSKVVLHLLDNNEKVIKKLDIKLNEKK